MLTRSKAKMTTHESTVYELSTMTTTIATVVSAGHSPTFTSAATGPRVSTRVSPTSSLFEVGSVTPKRKAQHEMFIKYKEIGESLGLTDQMLTQFVMEGVKREEERVDQILREEREKRECMKREERERIERERKEEREREERMIEREERMRKEEKEKRKEEIEREERREREREERRLTELRIENERKLAEAKLEMERKDKDYMMKTQIELDKIRLEQEREALAVQKDLLKHKIEKSAKESSRLNIKLQPFVEGEDVEQYLTKFQKIMEMQNYDSETWTSRLHPLLTGKALETFHRLDADDAADFEVVRREILQRYRKDAEYYRRKFRESTKDVDETFPQYVTRMERYIDRWFEQAKKDSKNVTEVLDMFMTEQLYSIMNDELSLTVRKAEPKTASEAAECAQKHINAKRATESKSRMGTIAGRQSRPYQNGKQQSRPDFRPKHASGHETNSQTMHKRSHSAGPSQSNYRQVKWVDQQQKVCYNCKKPGHIAKDCRSKKVQFIRIQPISQQNQIKTEGVELNALHVYNPRSEGFVNNIPVTVVRDTGAAVSAVAKHLAKPSDYTGKKLSVQLADPSHENSYDIAFVNIESKFVKGRIEVILIPGLDGVLLGNEVKFVDNSKHPVSLHGEECVQMKRVHTRAQTKAKDKPETDLQVPSRDSLDVTPDKLISLQTSDVTLDRARTMMRDGRTEKSGKGWVSYMEQKGVLYKVYTTNKVRKKYLCVPKTLRQGVLREACNTQSNPIRYHKLKNKIMHQYFWPSMRKDVRRYCHTHIGPSLHTGQNGRELHADSRDSIVMPETRKEKRRCQTVQALKIQGKDHKEKVHTASAWCTEGSVDRKGDKPKI